MFNMNGPPRGSNTTSDQSSYDLIYKDFVISSMVGTVSPDFKVYSYNLPSDNINQLYKAELVSATVKFNQDVSGSVRLRAGYAFNDILVFATSGIAISQAKLGAAIKITGYSASANDTRIYTGYTVGGGLEYGLTTNLIARTEYRFTQYEKASYNTIKFGMDVQEVRAGMAYKF